MIDVVLPCLDEAEALPWVLGRLPAGYRAIVVDNGSSDGSAEIAARHGATVVREPQRGFGAACHTGLRAATGDVVCFMDADASLDPGELPALVALLDAPGTRANTADTAGPAATHTAATGPERTRLERTRPAGVNTAGTGKGAEPGRGAGADLIMGRRRPVTRSAWPLHARLGNALLARSLSGRAGLVVHDLGPMRAARRDALLALGLTDRRFGYPLEMVLRAAAAGWRVAEVDVAYHPRRGRSKVTGTVRGTARTVADMRQVLKAATP